MSTAGRRTFGTLDGLRGIAALAVAFRHIPENAIGRLTPESYLAVDLFFVLSGFVLAHAYETRLAGGLSVVDFFVARLIRLYPLYLIASVLTLLLVFVPAAAGHYHPPAWTLRDIVFALLFVPQIDLFHPDTPIFALAGTAWSLACELAANLVFALIATRLTPRLLGIVVAAGAAMLVAAAWYFGSIDIGYNQRTVWGGFGRVGFGFFAGVATYRLWRADALLWLRLPAWLSIIVILEIFAIAPMRHQAASDVAMIMLAMPALVLASARSEPGRWLAPPFALFGAASYGIYVLQNPVDQWFETVLPWRDVIHYGGLGSRGAVAIVGLTAVAAIVLDRWFDAPVRAALTARWRRLTKGDAAVPRANAVPGG